MVRFALLLASGAALASDLLIVSPPALKDSWDYYATQRRLATGRAIDVVDTQDVYAAYPFGEGKSCRNAAESLHAFIRAAAQAGTTNYLLGGAWIDATKLEAPIFLLTGERLSLSNAVPGVCVGVVGSVMSETETTPSDFYYACVDSDEGGAPWDADGDGVYLTAADRAAGVDLSADVVVGRFPALPFAYGNGPVLSAAQQVTNYAAKVARAEGPSFRGTVRLGALGGLHMLSDPAGSPSFGNACREFQFFDGLPNVWRPEHASAVCDSEFVLRETFRTRVMSTWPVAEVEGIYSSDQPLFAGRYATLDDAREAFLAQDTVFSSCRSHGSARVALSGGGRNWVTRDHYARATGLSLFAEFAVPCRAGMVDETMTSNKVVYAVPCLGAAAVCSPYGGAVTGVFNSRDGMGSWVKPYALDDGFSTTHATRLTECVFDPASESLGRAFLQARRRAALEDPLATSSDAVFLLCEQFFFGDPTVGLSAVARTHNLSGTTVCGEDRVAVSATVAGTGIASVEGSATFRVLEILEFAGTDLSVSCGGGIGRCLRFTGEGPGRLSLAGPEAFYLGGVSNCQAVVVTGGRKRVRLLDPAGAPPTFAVRDGTLVLETAESVEAGSEPLVAVTNGTLVWAVSPRTGRTDGGEHLARPICLAGTEQTPGRLLVEPAARLAWGKKAGEAYAPFVLQVAGTCEVGTSGGNERGTISLVGTTTFQLEAGARLTLGAQLVDVEAGRLVLSGFGEVEVAAADVLAGGLEVAEGATLVLREVPCVQVSELVVRAGATLRIPASASGLHPLVPKGGRVLLEAGAQVVDLAGTPLVGQVADTTYYEAGAALRWKGGAGLWSDARGWYDLVTGEHGPWKAGRTAVFEAAEVNCVTNDLPDLTVAGFVFGATTTFEGGRIGCETGEWLVPERVSVTCAAPLAASGNMVKKGLGQLCLAGRQELLGPSALTVVEGCLTLKNVTAPGVTNLAVASGAFLALHGTSELTNAVSRASVATNALQCAGETAATLALGVFTPSKPLTIPAGVTISVRGPIVDDGGRTWTAIVDGALDYAGVLSGVYGLMEGTGTVSVAGLRSRSGAGMGFGACRLVWRPEAEDGRFPVQGFLDRGAAAVVLKGTTVEPVGTSVVAGAAGDEGSRAVLFVDREGCTFDVAGGQSLTLGDDPAALQFGGPGTVEKKGAGVLRLALDDLHAGATVVRAGAYAVEGRCLSRSFNLAGGSVLDFSHPAVQEVAATNFVWGAGSEIRLSVGSEGADRLDLRAAAEWAAEEGARTLVVRVTPDAPAGVYPLVVADTVPAAFWMALVPRLEGVQGRAARLVRSADLTAIELVLGPPATVFLIR